MKAAIIPGKRPLPELLPIDDLDQAIVTLAARINAETYELLVLIRKFDERAGWLKWGLGNCAEWLHYRCDFSMNAAREKVRVAHALKTLPEIAAAFSTGKLSYSKVRAMTRVTGTHNEEELLSFALKTTTARVEERCRELKCGSADSLGGAQRAFANRSLRVNRNAERGLMTITIELPMETGELVEKALDRARDDSVSKLEFIDESWSARQADAMVEMARDKSCSFPGCHHKRFVDAHHIQHWSTGGETSLNNLMLLCSRHHTLVHEGGFTLQRDYQHQWFFKRPDGRAVPTCGYHARDIMDDDVEEVSRRAGPRFELLDNPPAGGLLTGADNFLSEPPPPAYWH